MFILTLTCYVMKITSELWPKVQSELSACYGIENGITIYYIIRYLQKRISFENNETPERIFILGTFKFHFKEFSFQDSLTWEDYKATTYRQVFDGSFVDRKVNEMFQFETFKMIGQKWKTITRSTISLQKTVHLWRI